MGKSKVVIIGSLFIVLVLGVGWGFAEDNTQEKWEMPELLERAHLVTELDRRATIELYEGGGVRITTQLSGEYLEQKKEEKEFNRKEYWEKFFPELINYIDDNQKRINSNDLKVIKETGIASTDSDSSKKKSDYPATVVGHSYLPWRTNCMAVGFGGETYSRVDNEFLDAYYYLRGPENSFVEDSTTISGVQKLTTIAYHPYTYPPPPPSPPAGFYRTTGGHKGSATNTWVSSESSWVSL